MGTANRAVSPIRLLDRFSARMPGYSLDALAISVCLSLSLVLLSRQILLGGTFYNDDIVLQSIPAYHWFAEGLKRGEIPLWSTSILGGFPLAFAQYGFFYPPDLLLFRFLDSTRAFHLSLALHLSLAGVCTYWYCRVLRLSRLPCLIAALAFQMGTEVTSWPANGYISKTLFVLPSLLAITELLLQGRWKYWLLLPMVVGGALLVGYAQIVLFALAVTGLYAAVATFTLAQKSARPAIRFLVVLSAGVALGLGLAAVRVLPTLAVTSLSTRSGGMGLGQLMADSIQAWALLAGYLMPVVFELPGGDVARPDFITVPILFMALLGVASRGRLERVQRFHIGLAGATILLSMGYATPVYGLLLQVPFFSLFRGPNRFSLVAGLALCVLAAMALDRKVVLELPGRRGPWRVLLAIALLVVGMVAVAAVLSGLHHFSPSMLHARLDPAQMNGLGSLSLLRPRSALSVLGLALMPFLILGCARRRISHDALEWTTLVLVAATLLVLGWVRYPWMPASVLSERPVLLQALNEDSGRFRLFSWAPRLSTYNVGAYYEGVVGSPPSIDFNDRYLRQFCPPNLGVLYGVSTIDGYEVLQTRRQALAALYIGSERIDPARFSDGSRVDGSVQGRGLHDRLDILAAFNVGYLMHAFPIQDPRLDLLQEVELRIYPQFDATAKVYLYRLKEAMPRAFVVPEGMVMKGEREVLETLMAGSVDLRRRVILEEEPSQLDGPLLTVEGSKAEIVDYRDSRVSLVARTDGSGYLVLMDFLLPGWTAKVDGKAEQILAGDYAGRAVRLQGAGEHRVEFSYEAPLFREGLLVSLCSLILLSAVVLAIWTRSRHPAER